MAKETFNEEDGVWRTVGGRRIFIRNGQSLADAMVKSGKFTKLRETYKKHKEKKQEEKEKKEWDEKVKKPTEENAKNKGFELEEKPSKNISANDATNELMDADVGDWNNMNQAQRDKQCEKILNDFEDKYGNKFEDKKFRNEVLEQLEDQNFHTMGKVIDSKYNEKYGTLKLEETAKKDKDLQALEEKANDREFKASMGEVDIPDDFEAQFNDYVKEREKNNIWEKQEDGSYKANKEAMKNDYEERHKKYDAKIKQLAEDRENMTNSDWEASIMAYEMQNADGTYNTFGDIYQDIEEYEKKRSGKTDNSYTKEELKEKFGTDNVDLINAGRESNRRVSLKEEKQEKQVSKDGNFIQQTDMHGGTYEYTQQRLNEMKEHGTKPLEHSYTGGGWEGLKYDSNLSTKDIAKNINDYAKKEFPDVKISRKTDYNGIDMYVMSSDKDMFVSEKDIDNMNFSDLEQVTRSNGFNWWAKENVKDYNTNHSYSIDDVRKYAKEQLNTTKSHDSNPSSDSWYLSDYGKKVISGLNKEMNSYNYDDSDGMVDYFDTNFYGYVHIGKWDKPYQTTGTSSKSGDWMQKAYDEYKKEHPNSKMTMATFKKINEK